LIVAQHCREPPYLTPELLRIELGMAEEERIGIGRALIEGAQRPEHKASGGALGKIAVAEVGRQTADRVKPGERGLRQDGVTEMLGNGGGKNGMALGIDLAHGSNVLGVVPADDEIVEDRLLERRPVAVGKQACREHRIDQAFRHYDEAEPERRRERPSEAREVEDMAACARPQRRLPGAG